VDTLRKWITGPSAIHLSRFDTTRYKYASVYATVHAGIQRQCSDDDDTCCKYASVYL